MVSVKFHVYYSKDNISHIVFTYRNPNLIEMYQTLSPFLIYIYISKGVIRLKIQSTTSTVASMTTITGTVHNGGLFLYVFTLGH